MKSKTQSNGFYNEADTLLEDPFIGSNTSNISDSKSEVEAVPGFTLYDSIDLSTETYPITKKNESSEVGDYQEAGSEAEVQIDEPKEAYFSSYPDLIPSKDKQEVIIGTDDRVRVFANTSYPWRAICALRITAHDNTQWIGTGWLVAPRVVITAGHCVYLHGNGGWAKKIEVIPGLNDASRPYGSCVSSNVRSVRGWSESKKRDFDYGAIILPSDCRLGDRTGYFGYAVRNDSFLTGSVINMSGYPGDKGGNQQWFMAQRPKSLTSKVITYDIDSMGGQSGGPVWIKEGENRYCVGIHTNGHSSGNSATRIDLSVFNNIKFWKSLGL